MATYYVRSGASGAANGTSWTNAYTTLTTAFTGKAAGDVFYVSEDHVEASASNLSLSVTTAVISNPCRVICVDHAGSVPPVVADLRTTAQVTTTGNATITLSGVGGMDWYGVIFIAGNSTGNATISIGTSTNQQITFTNCSLRIGSTGTGGAITLNGFAYGAALLRNTTLSFANASQLLRIAGLFVWLNTPSALLGTIPTTLMTAPYSGTAGGAEIRCIGVDLSAAGSGKTLVNAASTSSTFVAQFVDCKLDAAVTKMSTPVAYGGPSVSFIRCDSAAKNYTFHTKSVTGTLDEETTIVLSGGASDGTTPIAWKIVTTANVSWSFPFESPPIAVWNDTTGSSVTATIQGIWGGGAVPNDDEIWVEVEYLGSGSTPQGSFVNDSKATILTTAAAQSAGAGTWGGSTTKFKLDVTFTPQMKGWVYARVKCAKVSSTFYVDPLVTLT